MVAADVSRLKFRLKTAATPRSQSRLTSAATIIQTGSELSLRLGSDRRHDFPGRFKRSEVEGIGIILPAQPTLSAATFSAGQFQLLVGGNIGPDYVIETSTNLFDWAINDPTSSLVTEMRGERIL